MRRIGHDAGAISSLYAALPLWLLGYPAQAVARLHEALALAHALAHPYYLVQAWVVAAQVLAFCRDVPAVHEHAGAAIALGTE
jgi:hypothetical protein